MTDQFQEPQASQPATHFKGFQRNAGEPKPRDLVCIRLIGRKLNVSSVSYYDCDQLKKIALSIITGRIGNGFIKRHETIMAL